MIEVEKKIQYIFKNKKILHQALTHRSIDSIKNYEKFEFLGDSIINFYITNWLFKNYKYEKESELSVRRSQLINQKKLASISKTIGLDKYINIQKDLKISDRIYCDIFESIIGAIYLDSNYSGVSKFLDKFSIHFEDSNKDYDFKGMMISLRDKGEISELGFNTYRYETTDFFLSNIELNKYNFYGFGKTKKDAEMRVSNMAYKFIKNL